MEIVAWLLVLLLAGAVVHFARRSGDARSARDSLRQRVEALRAGRIPEPPAQGEVAELAQLHEAVRDHWTPRGSELQEGREEGRRQGWSEGRDDALRGMARYVDATVTGPLEQALESGEVGESHARAVLYALEDLSFFGRDLTTEELVPASVADVVGEVTREFARDYEVPVKVLGPDGPIRAVVAPEALKDAIYLLMVNAVRFGGENTVEVRLQERDGACALEVMDRGGGFTSEALERGTEPFFSTREDALGLGLTWVQQVVTFHQGHLATRNREEGGAAVEIRLPLER